jgi:tetratricopeptide (TPR) repeat protein
MTDPSPTAAPAGSLEVALAHTERLLQAQPALAAEQAEEILKVIAGQPRALLLLGLARGLMGQGDAALLALRQAVARDPGLGEAWRAIGDHLSAIGEVDAADAAYAQHLRAANKDPRLLEAAAALCENRIAVAETLLREHLRQVPTDVAAIRMFAEVAARLGRYRDAENLLRRCLELAPGFGAARHNFANVLFRQGKAAEALPQVERLLTAEPRNPGYRNLQAAVLGGIGEYARAIGIYRGILAEYPQQARVWMSFGHALKTAGQQSESIDAYRRCIELAPQLGEAWWSLANLKTFRFSAADIDAMRVQLARSELLDEDRFHFDFALGKALEDARDYEASFRHYAAGNALRHSRIAYDPDETSQHVARCRRLFTADFFASRAGYGAPDPDPIFIVGLPRSGSTLLEQILASHSAVEGTMELPDITALARELGGRRARGVEHAYPEALAELGAAQCRALGERYLQQTRVQRKRGTPYFIDKMPNNFAHLGLIRLILPNARVIDARRHPLGCCFSGFKQHFARGQNFTYDLADIGRYYRDYVELMAHFDAVQPGWVHRVIYEQMIADTESEVRRLLQHCGLPFEPACLRFYENERSVRTASSEQVRQPIFSDSVEQWRRYDNWLGPLRAALGPVLDSYPSVPPF